MNLTPDILLVEDSQEDMELTLYALRVGNLADNISVVRDGDEALDFLFCRGKFSQRGFDQPPKLVWLAGAQGAKRRSADQDDPDRNPDVFPGGPRRVRKLWLCGQRLRAKAGRF
jgi:hypothetical protein